MSDERKLILKMLQENRISIEEADQLIEALGKKSEPQAEPQAGPKSSDAPGMSDFLNKTGPKMDQFMGSISSMIDSISQQVGPGMEKRFEKWFQQRGQGAPGSGGSSGGVETSDFNDKLTREDAVNVDAEVSSLRCHHSLGDVYVEGYDGESVQSRLEMFIQSSDDRARYEALSLRTHREGDLLTLELKGADALDSKSAARVDLYLKIPKRLDLDMHSDKYDIAVSQITRSNGKVKLHSQSGDLSVRNLALKEIELKSGSGNIHADQASELLKAHSQSGDVQIKGSVYEGDLRSQSGHIALEASVQHHCKADARSADITVQLMQGKGGLDLSSQSGDIELNGTLHSTCTLNSGSGDLQCDLTVTPSAAVSLSTHSGDVDLILRPDSQVKLDIEAQTGDIECRLDLEQKESDEHHLRGVLGNGEGSLKAKTKSGDVLIS